MIGFAALPAGIGAAQTGLGAAGGQAFLGNALPHMLPFLGKMFAGEEPAPQLPPIQPRLLQQMMAQPMQRMPFPQAPHLGMLSDQEMQLLQQMQGGLLGAR